MGEIAAGAGMAGGGPRGMGGAGAAAKEGKAAARAEANVGVGESAYAGVGPRYSKTTTTVNGQAVEAGISPANQKYVDILSPEAKQHILYGDSLNSGGHMYPGNPGKTTFPELWSADQTVHNIGDIATSPSTKWYAQTGTGGAYTSTGKPANWVSYETRDGVRIRVVYQPATGRVVTAFPDKNPIPSNYKAIK